MDEKRAALLRTHQLNIARYQRLLKFNLNKAVRQISSEGRLAEERFTVAILDFMKPNATADAKRPDKSDTRRYADATDKIGAFAGASERTMKS
jgi:hypothetical protein